MFQADGSQNGTLTSVFRGPPTAVKRAGGSIVWQQPLAGSNLRIFNMTTDWSASDLARERERRVCLDLAAGTSLERFCGAQAGNSTCRVGFVTEEQDCCPVFSYRPL